MTELRQSGSISWEGYVRRAFLFDLVGVTLQQWMERAPDGDEIGVRAELQRLSIGKAAESASEFSAKVITFSRPLWRADIFTLSSGVPGNFDRAHFHPRFDGCEPCDRVWDARLTADPFAWLTDQLASMPQVLEAAAAADLAGSEDCARIAATAAEISQVAQVCMQQARDAGSRS